MEKPIIKERVGKYWYQSNYTRNLCITILILFSILMLIQLQPLISKLYNFFIYMLLPFFLSLVLYYIVRPLVKILKKKMSVYFAISLVYLLLLAILTIVFMFLYPNLVEQISLLKSLNFENIINNAYKKIGIFDRLGISSSTSEEFKKQLEQFLINTNHFFIDNFVLLIRYLTEIFIYICITPFILFYLLKDDKLIFDRICKITPKKYLPKTKYILNEIDNILMHFITGRVLVSAFVSLFILICFLYLQINDSYILSVIAFIFFIIPTIGWVLASALPLLVGFSMSTITGIEVSVVLFLATCIEGLWLTPGVMGLTLTIHPLTMILILFAGGYFFGIIGLLFITPLYATVKMLVIELYNSKWIKKIFGPIQQ